MEHVISISPHGQVKAMHNDNFSMGFLGSQSINRASEIVWEEMSQSWSIRFVIDGELAGAQLVHSGFAGYDEARAFEVQVMNESMKLQASPISAVMLEWAARQRV